MEKLSLEELTQQLRDTMEECLDSLDFSEKVTFGEVVDDVGRNITLGLSKDIDLEKYGIDLDELVNNCGQFGSTSSRDVDLFVMLDDYPSLSLMKAIERYLKLWVSGMISARNLPYENVDIQFILVEDGIVQWSNKGNESEINNSIFYTFHHHALNSNSLARTLRDCPVKRPVRPEVGIKALKTVRSLLTYLSRTDAGTELSPLLFTSSLRHRCNEICDFIDENDGLLANITTFNKPNLSDFDVVKSIAFSFMQLNQLLDNAPVMYAKEDIIASEEYLVLSALLLGDGNKYVPAERAIVGLDCLIHDTLRLIAECDFVHESDGNVHFEDDAFEYSVRNEMVTNKEYTV